MGTHFKNMVNYGKSWVNHRITTGKAWDNDCANLQ